MLRADSLLWSTFDGAKMSSGERFRGLSTNCRSRERRDASKPADQGLGRDVGGANLSVLSQVSRNPPANRLALCARGSVCFLDVAFSRHSPRVIDGLV